MLIAITVSFSLHIYGLCPNNLCAIIDEYGEIAVYEK
jgi:hypothetical protein